MNFSDPCSQTGLVGAMGNLGGIWFALLFRYKPRPFGEAFWIAGVVSVVSRISMRFDSILNISSIDRSLTLFLFSSAFLKVAACGFEECHDHLSVLLRCDFVIHIIYLQYFV